MKITADKSASSVIKCCYSVQRLWWKHSPFSYGRYAPARVAKLIGSPSRIWVQLEAGVKMLLDPSDMLGRVLLETGQWEPRSQEVIRHHLAPGATFVDVGANIGYCSLKAAKAVGPEGRVVAIEANPETVRTLRANIQASGANVTVEPFACSDSQTVLKLFSGDPSNNGSSSIFRVNAEARTGSPGSDFSVPARPLDAILEAAKVSRVDVLKIDVEGAEPKVLNGARRTLARYRPVLLVELDDKLLSSAATSCAELKLFLQSQCYSCDGPFDHANFVFVPKR
jgi:FkbM family methyltransferase